MKLTTETITTTLEAKLTKAGFSRWTKGNYDRLYINATKCGLNLEYYNTGNIRGANVCGRSVSNSAGYRIKAGKIWYDLTDGEWYTKGMDEAPELLDYAKAMLEGIVAEDLSENATAPAEEEIDIEPIDAIPVEKAIELSKAGIRITRDSILTDAEHYVLTAKAINIPGWMPPADTADNLFTQNAYCAVEVNGEFWFYLKDISLLARPKTAFKAETLRMFRAWVLSILNK